jgi:ferrous iron transport protein B
MDSENINALNRLQPGEEGVITKVKGYGAFRKRINEMGFVPGVTVKVIKKAPLGDPMELELMGYRISLRKNEANLIDIVSKEEYRTFEQPFEGGTIPTDEAFMQRVKEEMNTINVALVGNPNCGKTTLFNTAANRNEKTGNYGGVTVDLKTAQFKHKGYTINITDLPGTYSMSEYTQEELYVRKHLIENLPDVVVNVVDASNLERNLYLTTQLIDMNIKVVGALNMYDELEKKGDKFDYTMLGKMIGIPFVPVVATKGIGLQELLERIIDIYNDNDKDYRHFHINYGNTINESLRTVKQLIKKNKELKDQFHPQYAAIKLLEADKEFTAQVDRFPGTDEILECAAKQVKRIEREYNDNSASVITDAKYAFIHGALEETYTHASNKYTERKYRLDNILTHKWFGLPLFFIFMFLVFQMTFFIGQYPTDWIDAGVAWLSQTIGNMLPEGMVRDLVVEGAIAGVGSVIVFFPQIMILFLFLSFMEDTGYMARVAFLMDKVMHKIGLHGKSVIPIIMGFGCNVPAIMATRTLENRKDRIITIMMIPFMSCGTKYPIYMLFVTALFTRHQGAILFSVYFIGMLMAVFTALMLRKFFKKKEDIPFVMELPPYRMPTLRNSLNHMWGRSQQYLRKMGTTILVGSIFIWALGYFPHKTEFSKDYEALAVELQQSGAPAEEIHQGVLALQAEQKYEQIEQSYIAQIGQFVEPVFTPLGYDWKIGVSLFTGITAKELILSSMGVLYQSPDDSEVTLQNKLSEQTFDHGPKVGERIFTPATGYSLMLFILIYIPCVAAIAAIKKEAGGKWALFMVLYSCSMAWLAAFVVKLISGLL